ncbi:triacylglycerol lipase [Marininema mesophilum]|uniref:triacylglycerol lipase n=1 Tax=Marininema mesophilum TaxID=1048340 RepID=A0A1H2Y0K4_9BACL|nr:lipase [Marininema mesophilum]SDW98328.1 triacylglycerol lipase [Marininema mesophilum]
MGMNRFLLAGLVSVLVGACSIGSVHAEPSSVKKPPQDAAKLAKKEQKIQPSVDLTPLTDAKKNNEPIIMVHGLGGFDELYGFQYWGGLFDIKKDLQKQGYQVYAADIGTFSSNWDRAVELYAQIKGGRADYGAAHAEKYGHARYGRSYPGLYPEWGEINQKTGKVNKVHLIGHSMGGQTVRTLVQLLEQGDKNVSASIGGEKAYTKDSSLSSLFNGQRKSWVSSVLTISSPHDGSTLTRKVGSITGSYAQQMIGAFAAAAGNREVLDYDFKMDQWGLKREPGESFESYMKRVSESSIWKKSKDTSEWELNPSGARELNSWVKTQPDVYYFSVGTEQTYKDPITGHEVPEVLMNPVLYPTSLYIGKHEEEFDGIVVNSQWFKNDGLANTNSMDGPSLGSTDEILPYKDKPQIGKWNFLGDMNSYDHMDIIGWGIRDMRPWYRDTAAFLSSLNVE